MTIENISALKIHKLTQAQYNRELEIGNIDENALYLTPDKEIDLSLYATMKQVDDKADKNHNHNDIYYTETEVNNLLSGKSNASHTHNDKSDVSHTHHDIYYTETEVNNLLSGKSDISHTHNEYITNAELASIIEIKTHLGIE